MNNKFWFVWNPEGRVPSFKHPTRQLAMIEAERLAKNNPGKEFILLESISVCKKYDVHWQETLEGFNPCDDGMPF